MWFGSNIEAIGSQGEPLIEQNASYRFMLHPSVPFLFLWPIFSSPLSKQSHTRTHTIFPPFPVNAIHLMVASAGDRWRPHSTAHCKLSFNQAYARVRDANYPLQAKGGQSPAMRTLWLNVHVRLCLIIALPNCHKSARTLLSSYGATDEKYEEGWTGSLEPPWILEA